MPLIRYFVFTGGALLALLFLADRYMTAPVSAAAPAEARSVDCARSFRANLA
ncbi:MULTISPECIES: hypothetical protein [unclassified Bradyrhizobium]|uniref:hypothetical protein n=1 Tax=unclassified Bradyrhizobium TaxID=2631580 RepID=UPI001FFB5BA2|nr:MULTISPECIES: hypothetical protein [unclassified Bradyrhizobium]